MPGARALLYRDPVQEIRATDPADVLPALAALDDAAARGLHAAGYLTYEAGYALEPALHDHTRPSPPDGLPLLWFGLFERAEHFAASRVPELLPQPATTDFLHHGPDHQQDSHAAMIATVLALIEAGDIYQANVTIPRTVDGIDDPLAVYAAIRPRAAMGHGALVRHDGHHILSFSPELFFTIRDGQIETRPMKGTAARCADSERDGDAARALAADPKQRAENLMIVDLLRNDLSRVCVAGSVAVPDLFTVETYPTVHQMTSRVTGRLAPGLPPSAILQALFPCGSVTGTPKIRAMEVIRQIEPAARGLYTGSIGSIDPDGDARFNVAIRTLCVEKGRRQGVIGIGSGVVADSTAAAEWAECLDKARFLGGQVDMPEHGRGE